MLIISVDGSDRPAVTVSFVRTIPHSHEYGFLRAPPRAAPAHEPCFHMTQSTLLYPYISRAHVLVNRS